MTEGSDASKPAPPPAPESPTAPAAAKPAPPAATAAGLGSSAETPASAGADESATAPAAAKPAPPAVPAAAKKAAPVPPAPQIPRNPGGAARLAKATTMVDDKEQPPLAGNPDLGWWVLNGAMTIGLIALAAITLYSCINMARAIIQIF